jgi:hypothetical protein
MKLSQLDEVERNDLILRFRREGLSPSIPDDKKLPHIWRWLGDAETNCLSLRIQIDKLYKQQERDIKVSHITYRNICLPLPLVHCLPQNHCE